MKTALETWLRDFKHDHKGGEHSNHRLSLLRTTRKPLLCLHGEKREASLDLRTGKWEGTFTMQRPDGTEAIRIRSCST